MGQKTASSPERRRSLLPRRLLDTGCIPRLSIGIFSATRILTNIDAQGINALPAALPGLRRQGKSEAGLDDAMQKAMTLLPVPFVNGGDARRCLSCGTTENLGRKRYCSIDCRQKLRQRLDMRIGLLEALNTRYATFYFSEFLIVMDVLPHGYKEIRSFFFPRTPGKNPGEDFSRMADILGETWWAEQQRTKKRYFATLHVLDRAARNRVPPHAVKPRIVHTPNVKPASLVYLNLEKSNLDSSELRKIIRDAYRRVHTEPAPIERSLVA